MCPFEEDEVKNEGNSKENADNEHEDEAEMRRFCKYIALNCEEDEEEPENKGNWEGCPFDDRIELL